MTLYMLTTDDKYQLSLLVTNNIKELAKYMNRPYSSVRSTISRKRHGKCSCENIQIVEV